MPTGDGRIKYVASYSQLLILFSVFKEPFNRCDWGTIKTRRTYQGDYKDMDSHENPARNHWKNTAIETPMNFAVSMDYL